MLYYTLTVRCPFDKCPCQCDRVAEAEPPPDAVFEIRCPHDNAAIPVRFRAFKPCAPFPLTRHVLRYPPPEPKRPWWQFWSRR